MTDDQTNIPPHTAEGTCRSADALNTHATAVLVETNPAQEPRSSYTKAQLDHRESSDAYQGELFRHDGMRVAICRDGIQWLLQRQRGRKESVGAAWDSIGFVPPEKR